MDINPVRVVGDAKGRMKRATGLDGADGSGVTRAGDRSCIITVVGSEIYTVSSSVYEFSPRDDAVLTSLRRFQSGRFWLHATAGP